uniref:Uncharacterized protein n=1 Tax=Anopheles atroparvus TaxID=41427 RepID=A0A182JKN5_ANOAO
MASMNRTPPCSRFAGEARCSTKFMSSCSVTGGVSGWRTTNATGSSPVASFGTPITAASCTAGCASSTASISAAVVLDQLLQPINDEELAVGVVETYIARVQPTVGIDGGARRLLVADVTDHHLRAAEAQLTALVRAEDAPRLRIDHLHLRADLHTPNAAGFVVVAVLNQCRQGQLAHSVPLADVAHADPSPYQLLRLLAERGGPTDDGVHAAQVVAVDERVFGEEQYDRRHGQQRVAAVLLNAAEHYLLRQGNAGHHVRLRQLHSLRQAGGAGGAHDEGYVSMNVRWCDAKRDRVAAGHRRQKLAQQHQWHGGAQCGGTQWVLVAKQHQPLDELLTAAGSGYDPIHSKRRRENDSRLGQAECMLKLACNKRQETLGQLRATFQQLQPQNRFCRI